MKTTVEINDELLADAKSFAAGQKITLRRVMEDALILLLRQRGKVTNGDIKLRKHPFCGNGLRPEIADKHWREIREMAYAERSGREARDDCD